MRRLKEIVFITCTLVLLPVFINVLAKSGSERRAKMNPRNDNDKSNAVAAAKDPNDCQKATVAAGCFWHVQLEFDQITGVVSTTVGYTGGHSKDPTYKQVCTDKTGHVEAVEVLFYSNKITYEKLLDVFWKIHDPTTLNRQGPDVGSQYRSAIFYHTEDQRKAAVASRDKLEKSGKFTRPIVTEIEPAGPFYEAEDYHQKYLEKRGEKSCLLR